MKHVPQSQRHRNTPLRDVHPHKPREEELEHYACFGGFTALLMPIRSTARTTAPAKSAVESIFSPLSARAKTQGVRALVVPTSSVHTRNATSGIRRRTASAPVQPSRPRPRTKRTSA